MRASRPKSAAFKGELSYSGSDGTISVPIFLYRKDTEIKTAGVEFHLYHEECGNRVNFKRFCSACNKDLFSTDYVKLAEVGDDKVMVSKDEFTNLVYPNPSIEILGTMALKNIPSLMEDNTVVFHEVYQVRAFKADKKGGMPSVERKLLAMFSALKKNKQAMIVRAPITGMERLGFIMPSGDLITLFYEEEIRENIEMSVDSPDAADVKMFTAFFKAKEQEIDEVSCADLIARIDSAVREKEPYIKATPVETEPVTAEALMVELKEYVETLKGK